jgi:hypothetical protein
MGTERAYDLWALKGFIDDTLSHGGPDLTLDEALVHLEVENQTDEEREDTPRAIRDGLSDVESGRTRPLEESDREFRSKRGLPSWP